MKEKKYKTIKEVSELLSINSHVIRYWDSKFDGLSTRLYANKQRFFNDKNIQKLKGLKNIKNDGAVVEIENSTKLQKINIRELNIIRKSLFSLLGD